MLKVFDQRFKLDDLAPSSTTSRPAGASRSATRCRAEDYLEGVQAIPGLREAVRRLGPVESPGFIAAATELVLEGLHLHQKLNHDSEGGAVELPRVKALRR